MDYQVLTPEEQSNMLRERIRQYEGQHYAAVMDEQTAVKVDDTEGATEAQKRQTLLEGAIDALRAGLPSPTE